MYILSNLSISIVTVDQFALTLYFNYIFFLSFYTEKWRQQQYHELLDYMETVDERFWEHIREMLYLIK